MRLSDGLVFIFESQSIPRIDRCCYGWRVITPNSSSVNLKTPRIHNAKTNFHQELFRMNFENSKVHPVFRKVYPSTSSFKIMNYSLQASLTRSAHHKFELVINFLNNAFADLDITYQRKSDDSRKIHFTNIGFKSSKESWEKGGKTTGKVRETFPNLNFLNNSKSQLFLNSYANKFFLQIYNCMPPSLKCKSTVNLHDFSLKNTFRKFFDLNMLKEILKRVKKCSDPLVLKKGTPKILGHEKLVKSSGNSMTHDFSKLSPSVLFYLFFLRLRSC